MENVKEFDLKTERRTKLNKLDESKEERYFAYIYSPGFRPLKPNYISNKEYTEHLSLFVSKNRKLKEFWIVEKLNPDEVCAWTNEQLVSFLKYKKVGEIFPLDQMAKEDPKNALEFRLKYNPSANPFSPKDFSSKGYYIIGTGWTYYFKPHGIELKFERNGEV